MADDENKTHRDWDAAFQLWSGHGCPVGDPEKPIPGEHPQKDH